jgi:hypothetical protein
VYPTWWGDNKNKNYNNEKNTFTEFNIEQDNTKTIDNENVKN